MSSTSRRAPGGSTSPALPAARLFAMCWGSAAIVDTLAYSPHWMWPRMSFLLTVLAVCLIAAGVFLLRRPGSALRLALLALAWVIPILVKLPHIVNHHVIVLSVNVVILIVYGWRLLKDPKESPSIEIIYPVLAPALRLHLILGYLLAALHKLNWDYLDPTVSCAVDMTRHIGETFGIPELPHLGRAAIAGSLLCELGIPVLLMLPRVRASAIVAGAIFHFVLGLDVGTGIFGFSCICYALFVPFSGDALAERLTVPPRQKYRGRHLALGALIVAGSALLTIPAVLARSAEHHADAVPPTGLTAVLRHAGRGLWSAVALFALVSLVEALLHLRREGSEPEAHSTGQGSYFRGLTSVVPLLILVPTGLAPYLGYKTVPVFSMYSNLRTEGGTTNHLFLRPLYLTNHQNDLVEILGSSSPRIAAISKHGSRLTYFELRRLLGREPDGLRVAGLRFEASLEAQSPQFWVEYRRGDSVFRVSRANDSDHELFKEPAWILRKLMQFRDVQPDGRPMKCTW